MSQRALCGDMVDIVPERFLKNTKMPPDQSCIYLILAATAYSVRKE